MRHPRRVVAAVVLVTMALGSGMGDLRFDNSYEIWFVDGDPALASYDEFVRLFGSDESLIVLVEAEEHPLAEGDLRVTEALSSAIAGLEGVDDVWSLTHMEAMVDAGMNPSGDVKKNCGCILGIGGGQKASNQFFSRTHYATVLKEARADGEDTVVGASSCVLGVLGVVIHGVFIT